MSEISQTELVKSFYKKNSNRDIKHPEVVDFVVSKYKKLTGKVFRDPDRAIRKLHQEGFLIKISKGVYRYNPKGKTKKLEIFTEKQKQKIFEKDNYKCVLCGKGRQNGVEIHADHIKPMDLGGLSTINNGQTLCSQHNFIKKNLNQTETGKKMYIRLYQLAKSEKNDELINFCSEILKVYEKFKINGHIKWEK